ncbi:hypothetical protein P171DRAFT_427722 [Karstenula rhodostoma CBS 690.94]|uniref:Uncharacterized protein n=1 Tax=Karstenula rhodostoma CBS 690.94 TaxID=1392251 RepID=A0A9P4UF17_9PLEO|nr:hypothetical protein P171DRAFT_427722 [Karstenula rhodostoma CBS 690.94]
MQVGYGSGSLQLQCTYMLRSIATALPTHDNMTPPSAVSSNCENYAESSPDPLAASFSSDRGRPRARPRQQPLAASSPATQNRIHLSSPTKQMLLSTPRTAGHSPWRIKVTVQAEPGSDSETMESPIVNHVTHTKTTTIPLKDPDASSPVKRRGRPRKSDAPPKRTGTPVRKKAASKPRRPSVGDTSAADVDTDGTPKKKRGRPRKVQPPAEDDIWGQARRSSVGAHESAALAETDPTPKKQRGRPRKSTQPPAQEEPVLSIEQHTPQSSSGQEPHNETAPDPNIEDNGRPALNRPTPQERTTFLKSTPNQTDLSRKLKARQNTPVAKDQDLIEISSEGSEGESDLEGEFPISKGRHQQQAGEAPHDLSEFEPLPTYPSRTPETEDDQHEDDTHFAFDEGATRLPDDTTIIDSENFSMISVDSLPSCASVTRPAHSAANDSSSLSGQKPPQNHIYLEIPSGNLHGGASSTADARTSHAPGEPPAAPPRYKTPSVEPVDLSNPPPVAATRTSPTEAQTPKIGRVVKAGVALQGMLDPNRATPEAGPSKTVNERRDHLDDLFRGFSERTRRELHAGLRLGEQLAKQNGLNQPSSSARSSPIKNRTPDPPALSYIAANPVPQSSRLLTPEDQDGDTAPGMQSTEVQYPVLPDDNKASGLLSPASTPEEDGDDMSWRIDTPPVRLSNQAGTQLPAVHQPSGAARRDVSDIWEEEAGRSSVVCGNESTRGNSAQQHQDRFNQDEAVKLARGELPRTRRRKSLNNFHYSDGEEAEDARIVTPSSSESDGSPTRVVDKGKAKVVQPSAPAQADNDDRDEDTEKTDDTGMFFQATLPNLFNNKHCSEFRRRRAPQQDVSLNLDESLLPESSPPSAAKTPATDNPNPFMDTPPQLAALRSSPVKSSPLRHELRNSDISSDSVQQSFEESTLPLAPSSPFHTYVEGDTGFSMASDQRQLIHEMAQTDSSLRRIRVEADEYLDAYEPQERSLHDLTEVTEPSRTWNKDSMVPTSSPPKHAQWAPASVSSNTLDKANTPVVSRIENKECTQQRTNVSNIQTSTRPPAMRTRSPPPAHPTLSKLDSLPAVEPWTKTHYKALDKLYQLYKKQPSIFSTTEAPNAAINATLLANFMNTTTHNFVGARYRAWGYNVIFTDALVVLCAAFMQLLTFDSIEEYEARVRKQIQVGDCQPGLIGNSICAEAVVERLATVVLGEAVRRDEKKGKVVNKSGRLRVEWL